MEHIHNVVLAFFDLKKKKRKAIQSQEYMPTYICFKCLRPHFYLLGSSLSKSMMEKWGSIHRFWCRKLCMTCLYNWQKICSDCCHWLYLNSKSIAADTLPLNKSNMFFQQWDFSESSNLYVESNQSWAYSMPSQLWAPSCLQSSSVAQEVQLMEGLGRDGTALSLNSWPLHVMEIFCAVPAIREPCSWTPLAS